ncbi:MAG: cytidylate kinase family protein [Dehalococcoidia bacterium]
MPIITISRGAFSGGKELAECIAAQLGYRLVSREVLVRAARQYGVAVDKLDHALTDKPGLRERMGLERVHFLAYIQAALCKEVRDDNVVYHGNAGHLLLQGVPHVIRVRVMANIKFRAGKAMEIAKIDQSNAFKLIEQRDVERAEWTRYLYNVNWLYPELYDVVINFDHITPETGCNIVCLTARQPQFKSSPEAEQILKDLTLSTEVRARIATEGKGRDRNIKVNAKGGTITLSGVVSSIEDADLVKYISSRVDGVHEVRSLMKVHTNW